MYQCPVCGYPQLSEVPRAASGGGSYEICPSCGFQFGVDDDDKGITDEQWREKWVTGGMKWWSQGIEAPQGWNAKKQMASLVAVRPKAAKIPTASRPSNTKKAVKAGKSASKKSKAPAIKKSAAAKKKPLAAKKKGKATKR